MEFNNNFKVELIQALEECEQYYEDVFNVAITKDEKYKIRLEPYKKGKLVLVEIYMDETSLENGKEWLILRFEAERKNIMQNIDNYIDDIKEAVEDYKKRIEDIMKNEVNIQKEVVYTVTIVYEDMFDITDIFVETYVYDTYERARKKLEKEKSEQIEDMWDTSMIDENTNIDDMFINDGDDRFTILKPNSILVDVQISSQRINFHPRDKADI